MIGLGLGSFGGSFGGGADQAMTQVGIIGGEGLMGWLGRMTGGYERNERAIRNAARAADEYARAQSKVESGRNRSSGGNSYGAAQMFPQGRDNSLRNIGLGLGGASLSGAAIAFGLSSIRAANDIEESESLVATVFEKNTKQIVAWSEQRRKALGMNSYEQRRAAAGFQTLFTAGEMDPNKAKDMSRAFTEMRDDLVSFYNVKNPEDATAAITSGISGESEPLRRYGIFASEETTKAYAYANGIAKVNSELTEQQKLQARAGFILESFRKGKAFGDLERTKDSSSNQLRRIQNQRDMARVELGKSLQTIQSDVIQIANDILPMAQKLVGWFASLDDNTRKWAAGLGLGSLALISISGKVLDIASDWKNIFGDRAKNKALDAITDKIGGNATAVMNVRAGVVYINGRVAGGGRGGRGGGWESAAGGAAGGAAAGAAGGAVAAGGALATSGASSTRALSAPALRALTGTVGPNPASGAIQSTTAWQRLMQRLAPWWRVNQYRPIGLPFGIAGGATTLGAVASTVGRVGRFAGRALPVLGGVATGFDSYSDYRKIGVGKPAAIGLGVGTGLLSMANPLAALAGFGARYGINRFYNEPAERKAERGTGPSDEEIKHLAAQTFRQKADYYNRLAAKAFAEGDKVSSLSFRYTALGQIKQAKAAETAADVVARRAKLEETNNAWGKEQLEVEKAKNLKYPGLTAEQSRLAEAAGMVPTTDLRDNQRRVRPKVKRDNMGGTDVMYHIPASMADNDSYRMRFMNNTPSPAF